MNQLTLTASIAEISAQRYTPAGVPAVDMTLSHESEQVEAGTLRTVKVSLKAVAIGPNAETLRKQPIGKLLKFSGFLCQTRNAKGTLFHIQAFESI